MSAFQAYAGAYEFAGSDYCWQCYATVRVHEVRQSGHWPFPEAPAGRKWLTAPRQNYEPAVGFLVDVTVEEFSQILLQVQPQSQPIERMPERRAEGASAAA
jgi:hypothetical protein